MRRIISIIATTLTSGVAFAHSGHGAAAGHDHGAWLAAALIAAGVAGYAIIKRKKDSNV